jgi:hypothetical protein
MGDFPGRPKLRSNYAIYVYDADDMTDSLKAGIDRNIGLFLFGYQMASPNTCRALFRGNAWIETS